MVREHIDCAQNVVRIRHGCDHHNTHGSMHGQQHLHLWVVQANEESHTNLENEANKASKWPYSNFFCFVQCVKLGETGLKKKSTTHFVLASQVVGMGTNEWCLGEL